MPVNEFGQPIGEPVEWSPPPPLAPVVLEGGTCRLEPLEQAHADALFIELCVASPPETWTYMPAGPFADPEELGEYVAGLRSTPGMVPFVVEVAGRPVGIATLLRIDPANGTAEVGYLTMGSSLQRTIASTEALTLLARHVFDQGYRRYEWKCDSLNQPSRHAAERLGFTFEGVFRQAVVYKGRNRDTAWYAMTDRDWPAISTAYDAWLDPGNFDGDGRQRSALRSHHGDRRG